MNQACAFVLFSLLDTLAYRRMPFGLCNAPSTYQRCMTSIFSDYVGGITKVFMNDFIVYGTFDAHHENLTFILKRWMETNLEKRFESW